MTNVGGELEAPKPVTIFHKKLSALTHLRPDYERKITGGRGGDLDGTIMKPNRLSCLKLANSGRGPAHHRMITMRALIAAAILLLILPQHSNAGLFVSITVAPPALPIYDQPPCPGDGYIWTPGYWAWDDDDGDYYWVPGVWVEAPQPGLLWTPGYWGWSDGLYVWNAGYWGPVVGFYGGVYYGFGYTGFGFEGGYWRGSLFYYNRSVTNVTNVTVTNIYNKTVIRNNVTNISYNGGPNGLKAKPTAGQIEAAQKKRFGSTSPQQTLQTKAKQNRDSHAKVNNGAPRFAALQKAGPFASSRSVAAKSAGKSNVPAFTKAVNANKNAGRKLDRNTGKSQVLRSAKVFAAKTTTQIKKPPFNRARPARTASHAVRYSGRPNRAPMHYKSNAAARRAVAVPRGSGRPAAGRKHR